MRGFPPIPAMEDTMRRILNREIDPLTGQWVTWIQLGKRIFRIKVKPA